MTTRVQAPVNGIPAPASEPEETRQNTQGPSDNPVVDAPDVAETLPVEDVARESRKMQRRQWRQEAEASLYTLWSAFTSLLTAFATRRCVERDLAVALLAPAAATLSAFSRSRPPKEEGRQAQIAAISTSMPTPASACPSSDRTTWTLKTKPPLLDKVTECGLEQAMKAAGSQLARAARVRLATMSDVREGAERLIGGADEEAMKAARQEVEAIVVETFEVCCRSI